MLLTSMSTTARSVINSRFKITSRSRLSWTLYSYLGIESVCSFSLIWDLFSCLHPFILCCDSSKDDSYCWTLTAEPGPAAVASVKEAVWHLSLPFVDSFLDEYRHWRTQNCNHKKDAQCNLDLKFLFKNLAEFLKVKTEERIFHKKNYYPVAHSQGLCWYPHGACCHGRLCGSGPPPGAILVS